MKVRILCVCSFCFFCAFALLCCIAFIRNGKGPVGVLRMILQTALNKRYIVGGRHISDCALRTTVIFSDGFKFISHKTAITGIFAYHAFVDLFLLEEIKDDAIKAHAKAFKKQERKNRKLK